MKTSVTVAKMVQNLNMKTKTTVLRMAIQKDGNSLDHECIIENV